MKRLSGYVFDTYDDVDGQVLRSIVENPSTLPSFVKTASRLTPAQAESLPDDQFALILFDGTEKMKKFATVDKGNTTLSVLYLLKQAHLLPPQAVKTAANNLIGALEFHGLPVPEELEKTAKSGVSPVSGKSQSPYATKAKVHQLQYPEILEEPKESHDNPQLGKGEGAWDDVKERVNVEGSPGTNFMELPSFSPKEKVKVAGIGDIHHMQNAKVDIDFGNGKMLRKGENMEIHPFDHEKGAVPIKLPSGEFIYIGFQHGHEKHAHAQAAGEVANLFNNQMGTKQQSWRESPYYDVNGWDPSKATSEIKPDAERTLLEGSYAIDGYDQVKTASVYFDQNYKHLAPRDRHTYCVKLASRMSELGMPIPEGIQRYGSSTYAADVDSYVEHRRPYVHEEAHEALDLLLEKRAQVSPGVFAEALAEFDHLNDLNWHYDDKIADPWYSTFGPSMQKIAEANWRYDEGGLRIGEDELKALSLNGRHLVKKTFGEDFATEFQKSPKSVFDSLPKPNKQILARLASDHHSGTFTEYSA